jgi:hypothetical protein
MLAPTLLALAVDSVIKEALIFYFYLFFKDIFFDAGE